MRRSKREALLDTAERLFYEEGFHATGIDRVVAEAGIARMTLYNHFPSKEALVGAVLERRHERYLQALRKAVETRTGSALTALFERHCQWLEATSGHGCMLVKAMGEFEHHHTGIHARALGFKRELLALIAEVVALDGLSDEQGLGERIFLVLEGTNQLVPILGWRQTREHGLALVQAVVARAGERLP